MQHEPVVVPALLTTYSPIRKTANNQSKMTVYFRLPDRKPLVSHEFAAHVNESDEDFEQRIKNSEQDILAAHADEILQKLRARNGSSITLGLYVQLRERFLPHHAEWARSSVENWEIWHEVLEPTMADLPLSDCGDDALLMELLAKGTKCKGPFRAKTERKIKILSVLYDVLAYATQEGLIPTQNGKNPLSSAYNKAHRKLSTIASERLSSISLTIDETKTAFAQCIQRSSDSGAYLATAFAMLAGFTPQEICGLNIGSWVDHGKYGFIEVTQMVRQKGKQPPVLTVLLDSSNAYRRFPGTDTLHALWKLQVAHQQHNGFHKPEDPLFLGEDGQRLTPFELRKTQLSILDQVICGGARLPAKKGGTFLTGENRPSIARRDFLRCSTGFHLRRTCNISVTDVNVLLGCAAREVYARHYADYDNHLALRSMAQTIQNRWHAQICSIADLEELTKQ